MSIGSFKNVARRTLRVSLIGVGAILLIALSVIFVAGVLLPLPGDQETPSGFKRNTAVYVQMEDGVKLAVDVWLPKDHQTGDKIPTLTRMTRYWRSGERGILARTLINLGIINPLGDLSSTEIFTNEGYANVLIDARGTGASFGSRRIVFSPEEASDYAEVVDWIISQPWSNGRVGAYGVSYEGNTAELLTVNNHPAVHAVAQLYSNFDAQFGLIQPGGLKLTWVDQWGAANALLDRNDVCGAAALFSETPPNCFLVKLFSPGVKPVDGHGGKRLLQNAIATRRNHNVATQFESVEFRNDLAGDSGLTIRDVSPLGLKAKIEASKTPMYVWTGWHDAATTNGAIERYLTFSNQQSLVIGPFSHGGGLDADPYSPALKTVDPARPDQYVRKAKNFFDCHLKVSGCAEPAEVGIRYFTMGEGAWHSSDVWPPKHIEYERFFLGAEHSLSQNPTTIAYGQDKYKVDFSHTTGQKIRWNAGLGGDIIYNGYREEQQADILTYETQPLEYDAEITGAPIISLQVSSTFEDGAFHAYLEDIAPDGTITYITEGVLRAHNRKVTPSDPKIERALGPQFSFLRQDGMPMEPGAITDLTFPFYSTSVLVKRGHRLRLALAGADASMFLRFPETGTPEWTILRTAENPSYIDIPMSIRQSNQ